MTHEAVAVSNWWYWVSRGHLCLYILNKVEIWTDVTDPLLTHWLTTLKDSATQLLIKYKSGALVTQQGPKINVRDLYQGQVGFVIFLWMLWTKNFDENWRPFARSVLTTRLGLRHPMALVMARFSLRTPSICHTTAFTIIRAAHNAIVIIFELNRVFR